MLQPEPRLRDGAAVRRSKLKIAINRSNSLVRDNTHGLSSVKMDNLQNTDQTEFITSINGSGETHLSIARSSEQTLALMTVDADDNGPAIVNVSNVLDKR